jgi:hypothetical protein
MSLIVTIWLPNGVDYKPLCEALPPNKFFKKLIICYPLFGLTFYKINNKLSFVKKS